MVAAYNYLKGNYKGIGAKLFSIALGEGTGTEAIDSGSECSRWPLGKLASPGRWYSPGASHRRGRRSPFLKVF